MRVIGVVSGEGALGLTKLFLISELGTISDCEARETWDKLKIAQTTERLTCIAFQKKLFILTPNEKAL